MGLMGCSNSRSPNGEEPAKSSINPKIENLVRSKRADDLLMAFVYLERGISEEESVSPASVYGEALSRQQQIKTLLHFSLQEKSHNGFFAEECSFPEIFSHLRLNSSKIAAEHEEFVARINRRAMNNNAIKFWQKESKIVENEILKSSTRIGLLHNAYLCQEELLGRIFGKPYASETERMLEKEVDRMRYYRDMLYIGVLQWEACLERIMAASRLSKEGVLSWNLTVTAHQNLEKRIKLTTKARDSLQEAILLIQSSEELLTDVQFPYCTTRELRGALQALEYAFTDTLIEERYIHANQVFTNLVQRAALLENWMKEILNTKMRKEFLEIDKKVINLSRRLKTERVELIKRQLNMKEELAQVEDKLMASGLGGKTADEDLNTERTVDPLHSSLLFGETLKCPAKGEPKLGFASSVSSQTTSDVINYFQSLMETKKVTMWPSRRIDELQGLLMQDYAQS